METIVTGTSSIVVFAVLLIVVAGLWVIFKVKIKGKSGEASVSILLKMLDKEKYQTVNNVILESSGGTTKTTQIDHVVVSVYGIFCIETKNYKGKVYGSENAQQWSQYINGHEYKFMNPVRQNYAHTKALESLMETHGYKNLPVHSIVAFPGDITLKVKTTNANVVKWGAINDTIRGLSCEEILSIDEVKKICAILANQEGTHSETKEHVKGIKEAKEENRRKVKSGICPKCGGELIMRSGKYGTFYGCSNYPKCRFTEKVES